MTRSAVLTEESELLEGASVAEPLGPVSGGTVQFEDGRTMLVGPDLVRVLNVLLADGLAHQRARLTVDSELVSAERAADMLGVSRPTIYKWQDQGVLGLHQVGSHRRVPREDVEALLEARRTREASDELLEDISLAAPLSEADYRQAIFEARKSQDPGAPAVVRRAQRAAQARAAAAAPSVE